MNLDTFLSPPEAARIFGISERQLAAKSRGKHPTIPSLRFGNKTRRYHLPTVIAHMSRQSGVSEAAIKAGLNL